MTAAYGLKHHIRDLEHVLDEYGVWFNGVVKTIFYPTHGNAVAPGSYPKAFDDWALRANDARLVDPEFLKELQKAHQTMIGEASSLITACMERPEAPNFESFERLTLSFETFMAQIRRAERDSMAEDSHLDMVTGFKMPELLEKDIRREMDRLGRHGKQFCLALVRIDGFTDIQANTDQNTAEAYLSIAAKVIRKSMRSFDDAYLMENGHFILSLKQTATPGAVRAMERIQHELSLEKKESDSEIAQNLSLSSCIAEPLPNDVIADLITNLWNDLENYRASEGGGAVLEHQELSPLERYMKNSGKQ
jgi:diguanylate cyclase